MEAKPISDLAVADAEADLERRLIIDDSDEEFTWAYDQAELRRFNRWSSLDPNSGDWL